MKRTLTLKPVLATAALLAGVLSNTSAAERSYTSSHYFLELDGGPANAVRSIEGGTIKADVITHSLGNTLTQKKQMGSPKIGEFAMRVGTSMSKEVCDWISQTVDGSAPRKTGTVLATDSGLLVRKAVDFHEALITEIGFPASDAASKDPAYLNVKFAPETLQWTTPKGLKVADSGLPKQKQWLSGNFRFELGDLDCKRVTKIDAFTIKQALISTTDDIGAVRDPVKVPGRIEYPNLVVTIPTTFADSWIKWSEDFLLKGNNADEDEKNGTLTFLNPTFSEELIRVSLRNVGVARLHRSLSDGEGLGTVTVELYVEGMEIDFMAQFEK